jgi:hypothetical protein
MTTVTPCVENIVGNYQCGFRVGKSTIEQIQSVKQLPGKTLGYGVSTFHLFIDFKAACDTMNGEIIQGCEGD